MSAAKTPPIYNELGELGLREVIFVVLAQSASPLSIDNIYEKIQNYNLSFYPRRELVHGVCRKLHLGKFIEWKKPQNGNFGIVLKKH